MSQPREIHLVNPLWNAAGGSELRTIGLFRELSPHAVVNLWTEFEPDADLATAFPIRRIDPDRGCFPRGGTLVFVGVYKRPGPWVAAACPQRTIVVYNTPLRDEFVGFMRHLFAQQIERIEVVYASESLRQKTKLRGTVEHSLIDLKRFAPITIGTRNRTEPFVVGRLSRNDPRKHHADDPALYRSLVEMDCRVRIMGGMCLSQQGTFPSTVEFLPAKTETAETFLQSLDCFLYRTGEWWEPFGRVVYEAMACGLPVVCHRRGGYVNTIEHGKNGFLFDTNDEALAIIRQLQHEPALRTSIGIAARASVEAMYSPAERAKVIDYYLL